MKAHYLFPNSFKKFGWGIFSVSIIIGLLFDEPDFLKVKVLAFSLAGFSETSKFFHLITNNIFGEIISIMIIVGAMLVAFSAEKNEDELISKLRLDALAWATYANYIVLIIAIIFVYGLEFLSVLIFNMFIILTLFILRFHWLLYKHKKILSDEE